ncbi:MAG: nucleotide sugar dehydrogenase [Alphaproteobacteria bacterium]|nr:nucleotide sugar dehydrogenase [Alphaproteobacteria bacterium]
MTSPTFEDQRICIVGMGYVGLTLAASLGEIGLQVTGIERNPITVDQLRTGSAHIHEVGLQPLIKRLIGQGSLRISSDMSDAEGCTVFIISVGTPIGADGQIDLSALAAAAASVATVMPPGALVSLRSTVKVGVTRGLVRETLAASGKPFDLSFCPERTLEGRALEELRRLPQIVSGLTEEAAIRSSRLFSRITPAIVRVSSVETAEVIKLVDNTHRDITFSISNEIAQFCDTAGIDAIEVIRQGAQGYERTNLPMPGPVGGPCLSKDPYIFVESFRRGDQAPQIAATARAVNRSVPAHLAKAAFNWLERAGGATRTPRILLLGMAFKGRPETDDLRGTTTLDVRDALASTFAGAQFLAWDPVVRPEAIEAIGVDAEARLEDAFEGADLVVMANNHPIWSSLELSRLAASMNRPALVYDLWNNFERRTLSLPTGVTYMSLGRHCNPVDGTAPV